MRRPCHASCSSLDDDPDGWVVLAFEDVEGRQPALPWRDDELERVLTAMAALAGDLTPSPLRPPLVADAAEAFGATDGLTWASLVATPDAKLDPWSARHLEALAALEARAGEAARGDTLVHFDLRADNLLLTDDGVRIVDWPHAHVGQAFVDLVWFAPSVAMQGGPPPRELVERYAPARDADPGRARRRRRGRRRLLHRRLAAPAVAGPADAACLPGGPGRGGTSVARRAHRLALNQRRQGAGTA